MKPSMASAVRHVLGALVLVAAVTAVAGQPPTCGNGIVEPPEECERPGFPCRGGCNAFTQLCVDFLCQPDCTCPDPVCGDLMLDPGEDCDPPGSPCLRDCDPLIAPCCTPPPACTGGSCDASCHCPVEPLHYQCYEVHSRPFEAIAGVPLDDRFGEGTVGVMRPKRICNPADKNDEDPGAPSNLSHLVGYSIRQQTPPFTPVLAQRIVNQFGTRDLDVIRPQRMLVPSYKSESTPPPPPQFTTDHFKCYRVRRSKESAPFTEIGPVKVDDQFGTWTVTLRRPVRLCAPADKSGEDPTAPSHPNHLLCYKVRTVSPVFRDIPIFVNNQLGEQPLVAGRLAELCVPSLVNPP
jgi:hypothetical protein